MGDDNNPMKQVTKETQYLLFGDFNEEEYTKYFNGDVAVKFVNDPCSQEKETDVKNNIEKAEENEKFEDVIVSWADAVEDHFAEAEANSQVEGNTLIEQKATEKSSRMGSNSNDASCQVNNKESERSGASLKLDTAKQQSVKEIAATSAKTEIEKVKPVKQKPTSWSSLFKSETPNPSPKSLNIVSVQVEQEAKKEEPPVISEQHNASKAVTVVNDEKAKALADFLHKASLHRESIPLQLRGLINNGNWCYINATLQSLLGCSSFYHLFKSMGPFKQKLGVASSTPLTDTMIEFVNEFSTLDLKAMNNKGKKSDDMKLGPSFEPKKVYEILSVLKTTLSETGKQQDAEEFLTFLLNGLHEEFVSLKCLVPNHITNVNNSTHQNATEKLMNGNLNDRSVVIIDTDGNKQNADDDNGSTDEWERVGRNNKSANLRQASDKETFITKIFGGVTRSSVHHAGAKESASLQPFFTIQLDIQAENIWNIKDAFENYFIKENLEGFTSSKTNAKVEASHKTSLEKLPRILILHLKYFVYDKTGGCQKTHKAIEIERELEIPNDVLSQGLKGRVPANQRKYELFAIEFHHGKNAAGGHYTTAVKHKDPLGWVYCNDNIIQKTHFSQIFKHHKEKVPYLLFYERVSSSSSN